MTDRFDLEQQIIKMFDILEDLRLANDYIGDPRIKAIIILWEVKIENLWNTFEEYVHESRP